MSNAIELEIRDLIAQIIEKIRSKHISIIRLCDQLYLSDDEFVDILNYPRKNISLYLEILDTVQNLNEV